MSQTAAHNKPMVPELRFPEFEGEWSEKRLANLFSEFSSGNGITSSLIFNDGLYPVYGGNGLRGFTNEFTHDGFYLLVGRQGALCGNINRSSGKAYISEHAIAGRANDSSDTEWLAQRLDYYNLNRLSESSAQPGLSVAKLLRFKLIVPSKEEQQKIASFLTAVDQRIQLLQDKKEQLEAYKKGVMQKLFNQEIRFKDDNGNDFPDWEEKKLKDICSKKSSNISANKLPEPKGEHKIYGATGFLQNVEFYHEEREYIAIVKDGAGVGRIQLCEPYSSVLGTLDILKPTEGNDLGFLFARLSFMNFKKFVTGSTIPHIYFSDYKNQKVNIPTFREQKKISVFISHLDYSVSAIDSKISEMLLFKKGLLQKMFI